MRHLDAWFHAVVQGVALVLIVAPAWAQTDAINNVVPATSTTLGLATVVAAVPVLVTTSVLTAPEEGELEAYLRANRVALVQDVSLGFGASLDDLATMYGLEGEVREAFGRGLRARRASLVASLGALDDGGVERFEEEVASWARRMLGDPAWSGDGFRGEGVRR